MKIKTEVRSKQRQIDQTKARRSEQRQKIKFKAKGSKQRQRDQN